jgi:hypothetical protein
VHTPSTRILSALAYDRCEEYDPADPVWPDLLETLSLVEHATAVIGEGRPVRAGASAQARARAGAGRDPRLVLRGGSHRRAVGGGRGAVHLTDESCGRGRAAEARAPDPQNQPAEQTWARIPMRSSREASV